MGLFGPRPASADCDVARIVASFRRINPLRPSEIDVLFDLIAIRLVISVTISAPRARQGKPNSEAPAWNLLARLRAMHPVFATAILRQACGFEAAEGAQVVMT